MFRAYSLCACQHEVCCNPKCRYKCFIREHIVIKAFRFKSYQSFDMLEMNRCANTFRVKKFANKLKKIIDIQNTSYS